MMSWTSINQLSALLEYKVEVSTCAYSWGGPHRTFKNLIFSILSHHDNDNGGKAAKMRRPYSVSLC